MAASTSPPQRRRIPLSGEEVARFLAGKAAAPRKVVCEVCENEFVAHSHRARFCCPAHKQQAYRARQREEPATAPSPG
jgi:hypothetical protein